VAEAAVCHSAEGGVGQGAEEDSEAAAEEAGSGTTREGVVGGAAVVGEVDHGATTPARTRLQTTP
jgi:hypothetical protein